MDMVEKVAMALAPMIAESSAYWCEGRKWMDCSLGEKCECRGYAFAGARAAIAAMREPTEAMVAAGDKGIDECYSTVYGEQDITPSAEIVWGNMIDAALTSSEGFASAPRFSRNFGPAPSSE